MSAEVSLDLLLDQPEGAEQDSQGHICQDTKPEASHNSKKSCSIQLHLRVDVQQVGCADVFHCGHGQVKQR